MKYSEVISQLRQWLPFFTDFFSDTLISTNATNNGGDVTIEFANQTIPATLKIGDQFCVSDAFASVEILDVVYAEIIAVETKTVHDYTSDISGQKIRITDTGYDETFILSYVPNRYNLELINDGQPPIPLTAIINQANITAFSGVRVVTAIDRDTPSITYSASSDDMVIVGDGIKVHFTGRITGCLDTDTMIASYTAQPSENSGWLWVIMGSPQANKSRTNGNDAIDTLQTNQDFRQTLIFNFSVFVVVPSKGISAHDVSGMKERDKIEDLRQPIFRALLGWKPDTKLASYGENSVVYAGESAFAFPSKAYYIHRFNFQWNADLTAMDTFLSIDNTVAFRDIYLSQQIHDSDTIMSTTIDLDDVPEVIYQVGFGTNFGLFGS